MSAIDFDNGKKFAFVFCQKTNEIGILEISEGDNRRAFLMTQNQFNQMLEFIKTEMPDWLNKIKSLQEQSNDK